MEVDHIFIFSKGLGDEADELLYFGLREGNNRVHKGQGTTNRKFYFANFFLEILWVHDQEEIESSIVKETLLNERAKFTINDFSRYGICLVNDVNTDELFKNCQAYQPEYFPKGMSIDYLSNKSFPDLPWTFRLPYRDIKNTQKEFQHHRNKIETLTKVEFGVVSTGLHNDFTQAFQKSENIAFVPSDKPYLKLTFDNKIQDKVHFIDSLDLIICY